MLGEFVSNYIQESVLNGVCKPADIRARAETDILDIDKEIKKIESLKDKQTMLRAVIHHLGGNSKNQSFNQTIDFSTSEDKLAPFFKEIMYFICDLIEKDGFVSNKSLIDNFGIENNKTIYSAIKWLGSRNVVERDYNTNIVKGTKWSERPKNEQCG